MGVLPQRIGRAENMGRRGTRQQEQRPGKESLCGVCRELPAGQHGWSTRGEQEEVREEAERQSGPVLEGLVSY